MTEGRYVRKVARHASEDRQQRRASQRVEPMLDRLKPGVNLFGGDDFRTLVTYFLGDDHGRREQAMADNGFRILDVEIKCDRKLTMRNGATVSEFAKTMGIVQSTLWRRVHRAGLVGVYMGGKKLFHIEDLESLVCAAVSK